MKKILLLVIAALTVLALCSCDKTYEPVASTEEEARVVMKLSIDGSEYDVKYELYRALFVGNRSIVDGGDISVWTGDGSAEYVNEINEIIKEKASYIYSVLHAAKKVGINPYSVDADNMVKEAIRISVEGDSAGEHSGHGSYENFLESLARDGLNYSVADLLLRYSWAYEKLYVYYKGTENALGVLTGGKLDTGDEKLLEFYNGEDSVRVLDAFFAKNTQKSEYWLESFRNALYSASSELNRALYIINHSAVVGSELIIDGKVVGITVGRYSQEDLYYSEYVEAAFNMSVGDVSGVIYIDGVNDGESDGAHVIVKLDKSAEYFEENKDAVLEAYISNEIGKIIYTAKQTLAQSATLTEDYSRISHESMAGN